MALARHKREAVAAIEQECSKRFLLLFDHYTIKNKGDVAALAWALAIDHVPGFKVWIPKQHRKRGRKRKWDVVKLDALLETIKSVKQQYNLRTDKSAIRVMVKNPDFIAAWGPPPNHKHTKREWIKTLENRLQEAKSNQKAALRLEDEVFQLTHQRLSRRNPGNS